MTLKRRIRDKKKNIDIRFLGLISSSLIIISEFLPWFSALSLLDIYIITTIVELERSFLYLFPLVSGIICLIGSLLIIYNFDYKINSVIISFIGLMFLMIFLFDLIPSELHYLPQAGIGFYFCIAGFLLAIFNIVLILIAKEK